VLGEIAMTDDFTHAVYEDDYLLHKYRWTREQAKWYSDKHPTLKIVKLDTPKKESSYNKLFNQIGECLF